MIHVFDYPFEGSDAALEVALKSFGSVRGIRKQTYAGNRAVYTGTRLVSLVMEKSLPRFFKLMATDVASGTMGSHWYAIFGLKLGISLLTAQTKINVSVADRLVILHDNATMLGLVVGRRLLPPPSRKRLFPLFLLFLFLLFMRMSPFREFL